MSKIKRCSMFALAVAFAFGPRPTAAIESVGLEIGGAPTVVGCALTALVATAPIPLAGSPVSAAAAQDGTEVVECEESTYGGDHPCTTSTRLMDCAADAEEVANACLKAKGHTWLGRAGCAVFLAVDLAACVSTGVKEILSDAEGQIRDESDSGRHLELSDESHDTATD